MTRLEEIQKEKAELLRYKQLIDKLKQAKMVKEKENAKVKKREMKRHEYVA